MVVGTTGDPATPLESTRAMAQALDDGRLVVVEADQHTGYNVNTCINEVVNDYLVDLVAPDDGTDAGERIRPSPLPRVWRRRKGVRHRQTQVK